jgi:ubiquinone/menaquinone biosynthesis C-methylase UbiE
MKLNVCCGDDYREGYVNIDFSSTKSDGSPIKVDLIGNVLAGLPYEDGLADEIVFRESLEHFNRWNGLKVLKDLYRVLKPGGLLDLTVPPALKQLKILMMQMANPKEVSFDEFERGHELFSYWKWHDDLAGATEPSDGKDGHSHKTFYTKQSLKPILEHVGFKIISIDDNIHVKATK